MFKRILESCTVLLVNKRNRLSLALLLAALWLILLISYTLRCYIFFIGDNLFWAFIISILLPLINRHYSKKFTKLLYILFIIINIMLFLVFNYGGFLVDTSYHKMIEPVTGKCFIARSQINFLHKGSIIYYERKGIFLCSPQIQTEPSFWDYSKSVSLSKEQIMLNISLGKQNVSFPNKEVSTLKTSPLLGRKFQIAKTHNCWYTISPFSITYHNQSAEIELKVASTPQEYLHILSKLNECKLVETNDLSAYTIEWNNLLNNTFHTIYIQGESVFTYVEDVFKSTYLSSFS